MIGSVPSRRLRALVGLLAGVAAAATWTLWPRGPHHPGSPPTPPGLLPAVVFLGDSITSGHRLPPEAAFPHRLARALDVRVVNAGVSGDTTAGGLGRLERDVLAHHPRLVVVELGVNDILLGQPRARTVANLRAIVHRPRAADARVVLLHIRLPDIGGDGYRSDLREIAQSEGAPLVEDFLDDIVPGRTYDGLHPDAGGHARLAERLLPVLRAALAP
jgi:acyl-CoA thioesterase-1